MNLSPRNRLILTIALVVVVAIVLAVVLIYPQVNKLRELDVQIAQAQSEIDQAQGLLEQRQAIKNQASQTDAALLKLSNEVPENPELPSLIIELQDTANEAGVEFRTLTPLEPEPRTGYSAIGLQMDVTGGWADAIDFMQRLNKLTRQVRIVGYTATPIAAEETENVRLQLSFKLEVYTVATSGASNAPPAPAQ